jgi:hypothetical protein
MAKRKELVERDPLGFLIAQERALAKTPAPTGSETNLLFILQNITKTAAWPAIARLIATASSPADLFLRAFAFGYASGAIDVASGQQAVAGSGSQAARGKLKGAFPLFVLELVTRGVPLEAEAIELFFGTAEDALGASPGRDLTRAHEAVLGLLLRANMAVRRPLALDDRSLGLDETGPAPIIRYRLEGSSNPRTCTDHNLRTRVIPAVRKVLSHK